MPKEITSLFAAQNAAFTDLFWILLVGLVLCVIFPERVQKTAALRKSFIALLIVIGTKAFVALTQGLFAIIYSQNITRENEIAEFIALTSGFASIAAAISWVAIIYGFWQLYRATAVSAERRVAARRKVSEALRLTREIKEAKPASEG